MRNGCRRDVGDPMNHAAQAACVLAANQPSTVPPPLGDRAEAIAAIERALRARGTRRWRGRWVLPSLATTAAAAALILVATAGRNGWLGGIGKRPHADQHAARSGELVVGAAMSGPASFELASGTRLSLDMHAAAQVVELGRTQRFRLDAGGLHAEVAKLVPGNRFIIQTPYAEVEVKGTRFDVVVAPTAANCEPAARTQVAVHEGIVAVRFGGSERHLHPGETWPACQPSAPTATREGTTLAARSTPALPARPLPSGLAVGAARPRGLVALAHRGRGAGRSNTVASADSTPATAGTPGSSASPPEQPSVGTTITATGNPSTLADQNDLMAAALAARSRGDVTEAMRWLDRLVARFPDGQLADSARAQRRRLLDGNAGARVRK